MRQIVVHRLRYAHTGDGIAQRLPYLRYLERGIHRVVATVVEEIADVVRAEDLDQPLVLRAVLVDPLQLEAGRPEGAGRGVLEPADDGGTLAAEVDQILRQGADDAVASGVDLADVARPAHCGLDDPAGRGVDDGGDTAGLGIERVLLGRRFFHGVGAEGVWKARRWRQAPSKHTRAAPAWRV